MAFTTEDDAIEAVDYLRRRHGRKRFPKTIRVYMCECGNYHFTRQQKRATTQKGGND